MGCLNCSSSHTFKSTSLSWNNTDKKMVINERVFVEVNGPDGKKLKRQTFNRKTVPYLQSVNESGLMIRRKRKKSSNPPSTSNSIENVSILDSDIISPQKI